MVRCTLPRASAGPGRVPKSRVAVVIEQANSEQLKWLTKTIQRPKPSPYPEHGARIADSTGDNILFCDTITAVATL